MRRRLKCRAVAKAPCLRALKVKYNINHRGRRTSAAGHAKGGRPTLLGGALRPHLTSQLGMMGAVLQDRGFSLGRVAVRPNGQQCAAQSGPLACSLAIRIHRKCARPLDRLRHHPLREAPENDRDTPPKLAL
jgi:hypothetical protein